MSDSRFFDDELLQRARAVLTLYSKAGLRLATAESCTGGLVAALLTEIPGSSAVVERGFTTYSNDAKIESIGVSAELISDHGAVSAQVARAMADGALKASRADAVVAITGVAGPDGGTPEKPVGLVHFAIARRGAKTRCLERRFGLAARSDIRRSAVLQALALFEDAAT